MTDAPAQDTASLRLCASRDIEAVTLVEDHGEADDIAPEQLAKAALTQMEARFACSGGHMEEGMALYNDVFRALGPMLSRKLSLYALCAASLLPRAGQILLPRCNPCVAISRAGGSQPSNDSS